jgi:membrane protein implicated in regulation of membrane protease activity
MRRRLRRPGAAPIGKRAIVVTRVDAQGGLVKIAGEEWSARAYLAGEVLEPGTRVEVVQIEGAIALVY